jgi:hypothetical protein
MVTENDSFAAFVPFFARWLYETHIHSTRDFQASMDMTMTRAEAERPGGLTDRDIRGQESRPVY